jgi:hypothetical protein
MIQFRRLLAAGLLVGAMAGPSLADDGVATVRYDLSIAGLPIGSASLSVLIRNKNYRADVSARIGGVLSLVTDGRGSASANGRLGAERPRVAKYALSSQSEKRQTTVRMVMSDGSINDLAINPEPPPRPDRVPVTPSHKRGVIDPVSALLMPVSGNGDLLSPGSCNRTLPIFDGAQRYDITLRYDRTEKVADQKSGYRGDAIVCSARYTPIAGHRARREQIRYMADNRDMEVWLAPVEGTRVLAPFKIIVATQVGRLVIGARQFLSSTPTMAAEAN